MLVSNVLPWPAASIPRNNNTVYLIILTSMNINELIFVQISEGSDYIAWFGLARVYCVAVISSLNTNELERLFPSEIFNFDLASNFIPLL